MRTIHTLSKWLVFPQTLEFQNPRPFACHIYVHVIPRVWVKTYIRGFIALLCVQVSNFLNKVFWVEVILVFLVLISERVLEIESACNYLYIKSLNFNSLGS